MAFFNELKRRNVLRVAVAYVVAAWLVIQVAETLFPVYGLSDAAIRMVVALLAIGLTPVLIFAWAFEMTPEGMKKESEVDRTQSITLHTGKKLDRMIMVVLALALVFFAFDKFVLSESREVTIAEEAHQAGRSEALVESYGEKSIAVLPFVDMSSNKDQEYMSDGIAEELLNLLAKIPELRVISHSSAFSYKGKDIKLAEVARELNVAHILEGSVRKAGNQVRITAQLIEARSDTHLWSETYDRSLDNIFAIQDEIAAAVVEALKIELLGEAPKAVVVNPEAYVLVLKGRYLYAKWGEENFARAIEFYQQALAIDPAYAEAWAQIADTYVAQTRWGYREQDEGLKLSRHAAERALSLDPNLASAWASLSMIQNWFEWDWADAEISIQKALQLAPANIRVLNAAGNLANILGGLDESLTYYQRILDQDPLDLIALYNVADTMLKQRRLDEAEAAFRRLLELNPEDWGSHTVLSLVMMMQDRPQEAWSELELEIDPQQQEWGRILVLPALQRHDEAARRLDVFIRENQSWAAYLIAEIYAWHGDVDTAFTWLERAYLQRDAQITGLIVEPLLAGLHDDPRWPELLDKMGLPH